MLIGGPRPRSIEWTAPPDLSPTCSTIFGPIGVRPHDSECGSPYSVQPRESARRNSAGPGKPLTEFRRPPHAPRRTWAVMAQRQSPAVFATSSRRCASPGSRLCGHGLDLLGGRGRAGQLVSTCAATGSLPSALIERRRADARGAMLTVGADQPGGQRRLGLRVLGTEEGESARQHARGEGLCSTWSSVTRATPQAAARWRHHAGEQPCEVPALRGQRGVPRVS